MDIDNKPELKRIVSPRSRGQSDPPKSIRTEQPLPPPSSVTKWSDNVEKVIKDIGDSCIGYKWMSILAAKQNNIRYDVLMYLIIAIGPLAGVFTSIAVSYPDENSWLQIISIILSFVSGVVSTSLKFSQLEQKSISFKQVASKYASLEGNIRRQLNLGREDRINASEYLEWVSSSFDELFASTPLMPNGIYKQWVDFAKKNNVTIPKELGGVITEEGDDKLDQLCTLKMITVNTDKDSRENTIVEIKIDKKNGTLKRKDIYNNLSDLNRFADGRMKYEMARLFGLK